MPTSKPRKAAASKKAAKKANSVGSWKRQGTTEVELPSGNVALVKRPGMEKLLASGILPDNLTKIAMEQIDTAQVGVKAKDKPANDGLDDELMKEFMSKEGALEDLLGSFDKVTAMVVVEPPVRWHRRQVMQEDGSPVPDKDGRAVTEEIPNDERDNENFLYTDDIDMDDKTFLFNFVVGGSRDLERFREEFGDALADVSDGDEVPGAAE